MTYIITLPCVDVKDLACVEECPVDCIRMEAIQETVDTWKWKYPVVPLRQTA